jgi:hypothetical protein
MKRDVYIPPGLPPGSYGNMHLEACLGFPCPTGYLAAGYVEMNEDLRSAHVEIAKLRATLAESVGASNRVRLSASYISSRAIASRKRREEHRRCS